MIYLICIKKKIKKFTLTEPDKKLYNLLKKKFKSKNKNIIIKNKKIKNIKKKFDVIIYFDVLEHIKKDLNEVKNAKKKLKKGGYLIFNVPAFQTFYNDFDKRVGHFKRYNIGDFYKISKITKLKVDKIFYYDSVGFLFLILSNYFQLIIQKLKIK